MQTSVTECVPLKVTFADGAKWISPHLPRLKRPLGEQE
jgi:hypothetical protein